MQLRVPDTFQKEVTYISIFYQNNSICKLANMDIPVHSSTKKVKNKWTVTQCNSWINKDMLECEHIGDENSIDLLLDSSNQITDGASSSEASPRQGIFLAIVALEDYAISR